MPCADSSIKEYILQINRFSRQAPKKAMGSGEDHLPRIPEKGGKARKIAGRQGLPAPLRFFLAGLFGNCRKIVAPRSRRGSRRLGRGPFGGSGCCIGCNIGARVVASAATFLAGMLGLLHPVQHGYDKWCIRCNSDPRVVALDATEGGDRTRRIDERTHRFDVRTRDSTNEPDAGERTRPRDSAFPGFTRRLEGGLPIEPAIVRCHLGKKSLPGRRRCARVLSR